MLTKYERRVWLRGQRGRRGLYGRNDVAPVGDNPSRRKRTKNLPLRLEVNLRALVANGCYGVTAEYLASALKCRPCEVRALFPAMARLGLIHPRAHRPMNAGSGEGGPNYYHLGEPKDG